MFQYTKENILNSVAGVKVVSGIDNPYTGETDIKKLVIEGIGEYYSDCLEGKVYKTVGYEGTPGSLAIDAEKITSAGEYILTFRIVTPNQQLAEFASPNWNTFGKPMIVGFAATEESDVTSVESAIKLALPEGNTVAKVEKSDNIVTITGNSNYITFDKVQLVKITEGENGTKEEVVSGVCTVTDNVESFATKEWIIENLRFPTYPNIRYASASTMPTADVYTEYAFTYRVPRVGLGGLSGVGQELAAVTRHILYVPVGSEIDTQIEDVFGEVIAEKTAENGKANTTIENPDVEPEVPEVEPEDPEVGE